MFHIFLKERHSREVKHENEQNEMQKVEVASLVKKVFGGSRKALFSALLEDEPLSEEEINELRKLIDNR